MVQRYVVIEEMDYSLVTEKELIPKFVTKEMQEGDPFVEYLLGK